MLDDALKFVPVYVLVLFRVAGMMIFAPLLGSDRIPRRLKAMIACVIAAGIAPGVTLGGPLPETDWGLAVGIGGEIIFGLAMGMVLSLVFVAAQWAGEMIGQQMGLNLAETFDPQFGSQASIVGDLYFFLTMVVFLTLGGHREMLRGLHASFASLPLLSLTLNLSLFSLIVQLFHGATMLAMQLAAPMLVTMLVVDLILGFVGKTLPQLNIMTAGISLRSLIGLMVLIVGLGLTSRVIRDAMAHAMRIANMAYSTKGG